MKISRWLACCALLCASALFAQVSAVLTGTITDPIGRRCPERTVTATNKDTGAIRETTADGAGLYQLSSLPVGQYEIHAKKSGFTEAVRTGVQLVVNQSATVDLKLQVGESSQQVTVNGDAPLVSVATTDISGPGGPAPGPRSAAQRTELRSIAHAESGHRQFHRRENWRRRRFELHQREQFRGTKEIVRSRIYFC